MEYEMCWSGLSMQKKEKEVFSERKNMLFLKRDKALKTVF